MGVCGYGCGGISIPVLGAGAGPSEGEGSAPSLSGDTASTLLGFRGQTTMAHIALFAKMHWPVLREPFISRTLAGVPCEQLQGALTGWVARVAADQELDASVDGKWAQSERPRQSPGDG